MLCIKSENTDPFFNLASEEYLLKCCDKDFFLLYRNMPSIVVGKHQNTLAEINLTLVQKKNLKVARRISGGGTVFHDLGNLNFTFVTGGKEGELVNYYKFTLPIIEALAEMGLDIKLGERNELLLRNLKISGTASHVYKQRVLHHGTLLFSSDIGEMADALRAPPEHFSDRAVKSIRSEVTNIRDHLVDKMDMTDFQNRIFSHIFNTMDAAKNYKFSDLDRKEINKLRNSKYSTWEWNFGYSPKYQFTKNFKFNSGHINLHMNVDKGVIQEVNIQGDFMSAKNIHILEKLLVGTIHDPETLRLKLAGIQVTDYIFGLENEELLSIMF